MNFIIIIFLLNKILKTQFSYLMGIGDWGLGIGDW